MLLYAFCSNFKFGMVGWSDGNDQRVKWPDGKVNVMTLGTSTEQLKLKLDELVRWAQVWQR